MKKCAVLWMMCVQFFVAEQVARHAWLLPYSFARNYVSDLGATVCGPAICSPWHALMNASFGLQGVLIASGAVLAWPAWKGWRRVALALLMLSGLGVIVVGFVPENTHMRLHGDAAGVHFLGGGLAMIVLGLAMRRGFGWTSMALGAAVVASTLIVGGVYGEELMARFGVGTVERVAAYGIAAWMVALGVRSYPPITSRTSGKSVGGSGAMR